MNFVSYITISFVSYFFLNFIIGRVTNEFLDRHGICSWDEARNRDDATFCQQPPVQVNHPKTVERVNAVKKQKIQNAAGIVKRRNIALDHARPEYIKEQKKIAEANKIQKKAEKLVTGAAEKELKKKEAAEAKITEANHYNSLSATEKADFDSIQKQQKDAAKALKLSKKAISMAKKEQDLQAARLLLQQQN